MPSYSFSQVDNPFINLVAGCSLGTVVYQAYSYWVVQSSFDRDEMRLSHSYKAVEVLVVEGFGVDVVDSDEAYHCYPGALKLGNNRRTHHESETVRMLCGIVEPPVSSAFRSE